MKTVASASAIPDKVVKQDYFELRLRCDGIVWLTRGSNPYTAVGAIHLAYDECLASVDEWLLERRITSGKLGTRNWTPMAWLFDVRFVSGYRNDAAFEEAIQQRQTDLVKRSPFIAVLVKTASGRMQMSRLRQAPNQGDPELFDDPDTAMRWLLARLSQNDVGPQRK